jgi:hypothetical protein
MRFVPFKPRILRFDEPHAAAPQRAASEERFGCAAETTSDQPDDSPFDTVCGLEFSTLRDCIAADARGPADVAAGAAERPLEENLFADDDQLEMLAQQLRADADRLATIYPADEPSRQAVVAVQDNAANVKLAAPRTATKPSAVRHFLAGHWHRLAAAALLVALAGGNFAFQHSRDRNQPPDGAKLDSVPLDHFAADRVENRGESTFDRSSTYAHGSTSEAVVHPIGHARDTLPDGLPADLWSPGEGKTLRDLGPDDSQDFCEVSM